MIATTNIDTPPEEFPLEDLHESLKFQRWRYLDYEKSKAIPMNMMVMHELRQVDLDAFSRAVNTMVQRHESLRTLFTKKDDVVYQCVMREDKFQNNVTSIDISGNRNQEQQLLVVLKDLMSYVYDYQREQAFKCSCIKCANDKYVMAFVIDHMISDAHSKPIIIKELKSLYEAYATGGENPLPPLRTQLKDYSKFHNQHYADPLKTQHENYFKQLFSDLPPRLKIDPDLVPVKKDDSVNKETPEGRYKYFMEDHILDQIKKLISGHKITFFNVMLTSFFLFLSRISRQKEFIVDSPATTRNADFQNIIGWLIGPLVSRAEVNEECSFSDLLLQCREVTSKGLDHIYFNTYSDLLEVEWNEVVSTQLNVLNSLHHPLSGNPNVGYEAMENFVFDLTFNIQVYQNGVLIDCLYKPSKVSNTQVKGLCEYYGALLEQAIVAPDMPLKNLGK